MKTLYKKASHLRAHTWKDIGGVGGLLLDAVFFVFLLVVSAVVLLFGVIAVVLDYLFSPALGLLSRCGGSQKKDWDEAVLLEDGTLGTRPSAPPSAAKTESLSATKAG
jgi:hypothetical protein